MTDPFNAAAPADFTSPEKHQFIDMTSDSILRLRFAAQTLSKFWLGVIRRGWTAVGIRLPFATSFICEKGFFAVASVKTKCRF